MTNTTQASASTPLNIWPVAQVTAQQQRADRYHRDSTQHPGKMLPSLARRIVEEYSSPGDLVVDPMAGTGTTVVEGAAIGRRCIGVDLEQRWIDIARQNVDTVLNDSQRALTDLRQGDARNLTESLGDATGAVDLIATSPPYACEVAVINRAAWDSGGSMKQHSGRNYSDDKSNAGHARGDEYERLMTEIYASCLSVLRPGGYLVTVTKNMRRKGRLIDLAETTVRLAESVGFTYVQHNIALLCGVRDGGLIGRPSYWQSRQVGRARSHGIPQHLVCHEDVLAFRVGVAHV